jgi:NADH:ubiquinone oxidoreductase subunit 6 (subunit J)
MKVFLKNLSNIYWFVITGIVAFGLIGIGILGPVLIIVNTSNILYGLLYLISPIIVYAGILIIKNTKPLL